MIKLFVSDMDGTLLNEQHVISDRTALAINKLQEHGIEFLIATGRDYRSAKHLLEHHDIHCQMINLNGASFADIQGKITAPNPMPKPIAFEILTYLTDEKIEFTLMAIDGFYVPNKQQYINRIKHFLANMTLEATGQKKLKVSDLTDAQLLEHMDDLKLLNLNSFQDESLIPLKIMVMSPSPEKLIEFKTKFSGHPDLDITSSNADNLEVTSHLAQKGLAILQYAQQKGYHADEVLTIGDSLNDRSMLKMFQNSYAMANASDQVKAMAKYLAPDHQHDGVAQIIDEIIKERSH